MTTDNLIDLLIIACSGLLVWALAVTLTLWNERRELKTLRKSKDDLRESMSNTNYYLHQQLDRMASENLRIRTQLHQIRKIKQNQD